MAIGLTGSIGSGKSTVSARLAELGALVLDADIIAREAVEPGTDALAEILRTFGPGVITAGGELDRRALAALVFGDGEKLAALNGIIHPFVLHTLISRTHVERAQRPDRLIVWDVPLLIECGWTGQVDEVWLVCAPRETRLERVMARDGCTREAALGRMAAQMEQEEKEKHADVIIDNGGDIAALILKTDELYSAATGGARK